MFFYKVVEWLVSAIPANQFLTPQKPVCSVCARNTADYSTNNLTDSYTRNNNRCFKIPQCGTNQ